MAEQNHKLVHTFAALAELGQEITGTFDFQKMIRTSLHLLVGSLAIMRGGVGKFNRFSGELNFLAVRGLGDEFPLAFSLSRQAEREFLDTGLNAIEINSHAENWTPFVKDNLSILVVNEIELLVPLVVRDELIGLILLGGKASGERFSAEDKEIICAMARHIAVGIVQRNMLTELERRAEENFQLYQTLQFTYKSTVESFAAAIDCKDKYTEGHSQRVGKYSEIIAEELGYDAERVQGVAVAGYLHDVGKLVVDSSIINAPRAITEQEFAALTRHTTVGYNILAPIEHPFAEVPLAAKYHHERLDGRGYPENLRDNEIPYIAKIVTLADSFDAMTTDRPYKRRRAANEVIEDLQRNVGGQFTPELVTAFCSAWLKELNGETKRKRILKMLGKNYCEAEQIAPLLQNALNEISPTTRLTLVAN
jgi:HD-GYP domain-containing protein (c-di-GMP phosphodiesterase class II)